MVLNKNESEIERLMREGQASAKRGDKAMARTLLTQLLELEPNNEHAWMWLSGAVSDLTEQQTCLENVLIINPNNAQARKGLDYIRAKSGRPTSAAFDRLSGPLSAADLPPDALAASNASDASETGVAPMQPDAAKASTDRSETAVQPAPWEDTQGDDTADVPSETNAPDFMQTSPVETPHAEEILASIDDVMPFQAPDDQGLSVSTGGPIAEGTPLDTSMDVPDWVHNLSTQGVTQNIEAPRDIQNGYQAAGATSIPIPTTNGTTSQQAQTAPGLEGDLNAWLEDLAANTSSGERPQTEGATVQLGAPGTEQLAPFDQFPPGPFGSANSGPMDFPPVGPFTATQLPSPDDLPGSHASMEGGQPWYLQNSEDSSAISSGQATYMEPHVVPSTGAEPSHDTGPVATLECPNCQHQVPETSLACPECRYSFFVHCPHCHELVDTSTAILDVIEPCPYCGVDIDKMNLGLSSSGPTSPRLSAPKETEKSWVGEGLIHPGHRSGLLLSLSWLVDLVWLMIIVMMVWALTQLPTWWHLTNLYN